MIIEIYRKSNQTYVATLYGITNVNVVADVYQLAHSNGNASLYHTETYDLRVRCEK